MIRYAGGTNVNHLFTNDTTQQTLISTIEDCLNTAGWTTISGHHSATIVLQSATTPTANNSICVRLKTTANNCATVEILNAAASLIGQIHFLFPTNAAANQFRVIANQYQACVSVPGLTTARGFVFFGVPWIPPFLVGVLNGDYGWIMGNSRDDTGTASASFRTIIASATAPRTSVIMNAVLLNLTANDNAAGLRLMGHNGSYAYGDQKYWHDGVTQFATDPLLLFGITSGSDTCRIRGQLWDAILLSDAWVIDTAITFDSKSWLAITGGNSGGTLAVLIP